MSEISNGIDESNKLLEYYKKFEQQRRKYKQEPLVKVPEKMLEPSITGWKIVRILANNQLDMDTIALLELKIYGTIHTPTGSVIRPANLQTGDKYCTNECVVSAVQFVGTFSENIKKLLENFTNNNDIKLVSNFDPNFEYKLGHIIREKESSKPGIGCTQGMHFFIDKKSCFQYLEGGFAGIPMCWPTITGPIESTDIDEKKLEQEIPVNYLNDEVIDNIRRCINEQVSNLSNKFKGLPRLKLNTPLENANNYVHRENLPRLVPLTIEQETKKKSCIIM